MIGLTAIPALAPRSLVGRARFGLRTYLIGLVALVVLPVLVAGAWGIAFAVDRAEMQYQRSREQLAMTLAVALGEQIERLKPMLHTLAHDPAGRPDAPEADRRAFHDRLRHLGAEVGTLFLIHCDDAARPWVMASSLPFGSMPEGSLPQDLLARCARPAPRDRVELGSLVPHSAISDGPAVQLVIALSDGGAQVGSLGALVPIERFRRILLTPEIDPSEWVTLIDGARRIVATSVDHERREGLTVPESLGPPPGMANGTLTGALLHGMPARISFARLPHAPGWTVGIATPEHVYRAGRLRRWLLFAPGPLISIVLGLLGGLALARHLVRSVDRVMAGAEAVSAGRPWPAAEPGAGVRIGEFLRLEKAVQRSQEQLLAETKAAERREALLHSVTESTTYAIFVKDREGRYQLVNRAAARGLGHPPDAIIGRTDADLLPNAASRFHANDLQVLATGQAGLFEVQVTDTKGARRIWLAAKAPWRDPRTGDVLGVVGLARDVTDERAAEARLREAEQTVQTLARRATINAMASGMAHELSQPLTAAANYLQVAATLAARDGSANATALRLGQEQVQRVGDILRQVRQFLRRGDTERRRSVIGELVQDAMHLTLAGSDAELPQVDFQVEPGLPTQLVNPVQIQQVVINLVRNAREALAELPPGTPGRISVRVAAQEDGGVSVTVEDNGPGIPEAILGTLFEPFRSTKPDGSGIGLAICRAIVESHGGRITVAPVEGGGTRVRFTLPGAGEAVAGAGAGAGAAP